MSPQSKAEAFAEDAKNAGWRVGYIKDGTREVVTSTKSKDKDVILVMSWVEGRYDYKGSHLLIHEAPRTVRNASEARRMLAGEGLDKAPVVRTKATKKAAAKIKADPVEEDSADVDLYEGESWESQMNRLRDALPFRVSSPSEQILKAVIGKEITWVNSKSKVMESARVMSNPNQRQLKIEYTAQKRRVLTFASFRGGFRSIHVDQIVGVRG